MSKKFITLLTLCLTLVSLSIGAAEKNTGHDSNMSHSAMMKQGGQPEEGGQAIFAALIEIVSMLEKDASTAWQDVDIDGLRAHLLDMNHLMHSTEATKSFVGNTQIRFEIIGSEASIPSIPRRRRWKTPMHL